MSGYQPEQLNLSDEQAAAVEAAADAWHNDLVILDNYTVYALAGNANNENLQQRIVEVKEGGRGAKQPVGWTRPFDERVLSTIAIDAISEGAMQKLLRDPDALTARLGGLSFIRAAADDRAKEQANIPDSIIPGPGSTVQIYSPEGVATTSLLTHAAIAKGAETVMTSANRSGEPESVTSEAAIAFVDSTNPAYQPPSAVIVCSADEDKPQRPRGSYPVVSARAEYFEIIRPGCFEPSILMAALDGYPVRMSETPEQPKYPDGVLRMQDLPEDVQRLRGAEFRLGLLATLRWSEMQPASLAHAAPRSVET